MRQLLCKNVLCMQPFLGTDEDLCKVCAANSIYISKAAMTATEAISRDHPERDSGRAGIAGIFEAIVRERKFQDKKYGSVLIPDMSPGRFGAKQGPGGHEFGAWLIILEKELDEAKDALVHGGGKTAKGRNTIRAELIQIAAVAVAALEQHGLEDQ